MEPMPMSPDSSEPDPAAVRDPAFVTAVTTEHFVLQSAAATTVTEAAGRASLYALTLSSSLVAMGFTVKTNAFAPLAATILPVIVVLGVFTTVRLVDTGVQNVQILSAIARIREYYRSLASDGSYYFPSQAQTDVDEALASLATARRRTTVLFTTASMVAVINGVVAAAGVTLLLNKWVSTLAAVLSGAVVAVMFVAIFLWYQNKRYSSLNLAPIR
jgi:hypothetical protein